MLYKCFVFTGIAIKNPQIFSVPKYALKCTIWSLNFIIYQESIPRDPSGVYNRQVVPAVMCLNFFNWTLPPPPPLSVNFWIRHWTYFKKSYYFLGYHVEYIYIYSKTCTYRNALGTKFYPGLDSFRFGQCFCFWRGTNSDNLVDVCK